MRIIDSALAVVVATTGAALALASGSGGSATGLRFGVSKRDMHWAMPDSALVSVGHGSVYGTAGKCPLHPPPLTPDPPARPRRRQGLPALL